MREATKTELLTIKALLLELNTELGIAALGENERITLEISERDHCLDKYRLVGRRVSQGTIGAARSQSLQITYLTYAEVKKQLISMWDGILLYKFGRQNGICGEDVGISFKLTRKKGFVYYKNAGIGTIQDGEFLGKFSPAVYAIPGAEQALKAEIARCVKERVEELQTKEKS